MKLILEFTLKHKIILSSLAGLIALLALIAISSRFTATAASPLQASSCQLAPFQKAGSIAINAVDSVVVADFNRDGKQDVVVVRGQLDGAAQTFLGDGAGGFTQSSSSNGFSLFERAEILTGDFNGDGFPDLYVRRDDTNNKKVEIYLNDGQGRFTFATEIAARVSSFVIGDLNKDGLDDIVASINGNFVVYLANANRTLTRLPNSFGSDTSAVLLDINGDGKLDFVNALGSFPNSTLFIWMGNGDGTFSQVDFLSLPDAFVKVQKVADLNRDGRPDIIARSACGSASSNKTNLYLLLNNGHGNFSTKSFAVPGLDCNMDQSIKFVQDFTGDGFPDIGLVDGRIAINDGQGDICSLSQVCCLSYALNLPVIYGVADFNSDGLADVINRDGAGSLAIWSSKGGSTQNTPPTIALKPSQSFLQGYQDRFTTTTYFLATVNDAETPVNNLSVNISDAPQDVRIFNVTNNNGVIGAQFDVGCDVPVGQKSILITVTDGGGLSTSASWTFNVTPKQNPKFTSLGSLITVEAGKSIDFIPPGATDGSGVPIIPISVTASASFTGKIENLNNSIGSWRISNAGPVGTHQLIYNATDRCGLQSTLAVALIVTGTTTGGGCTIPTFNPAQFVSAGNTPYGLASGDFDGDGKADLAVTNFYEGTVRIILSGTTPGAIYNVGILPNYVAAKDLNGDGKPDLAVVNRGSDTITILLGNGNGTFTKKDDYQIGNKSIGVSIGDFNNDGKLDLALPNDGLGNIAILDGNGDGSFKSPRYFYAGISPQPGVVGDFNKDGNLDLAFPNYLSGDIAVLLGNGLGAFSSPLFFSTNTGPGVETLAVGDLDGDGNLDLAVSNTTTNVVAKLFGNGRGIFNNGGAFNTFNAYPASILIADFDGDGKTDIATAGYSDNTVRIFKGLGNGAFDNNNPVIVNVGSHPLSLQSGDFNGDGKPDLAVANNGSNTVTILLNGCTK